MTPVDLANLYSRLRQRVTMHVQDACADVSVQLPSNFDDELAFYRLVNWAYILVNEAAKIPIKFLIGLPPLRVDDNTLQKSIGFLRTYVAHNLDVSGQRDRKTAAFAHGWFREACGIGSPHNSIHFQYCCIKLADSVAKALNGAIAACDALDNYDDGPRLVSDLKQRISINWDAHLFDEIVNDCANDLGNPSLDLLGIRKKNLDSWRTTISLADEENRNRALKLKIEECLLKAIGDTLPITAQEATQRLAISGKHATVAALIMLRDARKFGSLNIPEIIEDVCKFSAVTSPSLASE